jgi:hypothetical protein
MPNSAGETLQIGSNVLDKRYYVSHNTPGLALWYGEPCNFMLRIDAKFC